MNVGTARFLLWVISVFALVLLVYMGHKSFENRGILNLEFLGFVLSTAAFTECIRADERLKNK